MRSFRFKGEQAVYSGRAMAVQLNTLHVSDEIFEHIYDLLPGGEYRLEFSEPALNVTVCRIDDTEDSRRSLRLHLTHRYAVLLIRMFRAERRYLDKQILKRPYTPAPGKWDTRQMKSGIMSDLITQLESQHHDHQTKATAADAGQPLPPSPPAPAA